MLTFSQRLSDSANTPKGCAILLIVFAPNPPRVKALIPSDRLIRSGFIFEEMYMSCHFFTESANSPIGLATLAMVSAPSPPKVFAKFPIAILPKALPIASNPRFISYHDILPNFFKASANSPKLDTATTIVPAPSSPLSPVSVPSKPLTTPNSTRAPPSPANPFMTSSSFNFPIFRKAFDISSRL